jgi:hypothetical protein
MSSTKVKESRAHYTAQAAVAKQPSNKRPSVAKTRKSASIKSIKRSSGTVVFAGSDFDEINQNLRELKAGLADIQQRLLTFERQISDLNVAQQLPQASNPTAPADLGWLSLAESVFDFWDNPDDDIYDTL